MSKTGITERILLETVARFEDSDPGNSGAAKQLREGIAEGKLRDPEWVASVLAMSESIAPAEEP